MASTTVAFAALANTLNLTPPYLGTMGACSASASEDYLPHDEIRRDCDRDRGAKSGQDRFNDVAHLFSISATAFSRILFSANRRKMTSSPGSASYFGFQ